VTQPRAAQPQAKFDPEREYRRHANHTASRCKSPADGPIGSRAPGLTIAGAGSTRLRRPG
jgi:hypothetical protein